MNGINCITVKECSKKIIYGTLVSVATLFSIVALSDTNTDTNTNPSRTFKQKCERMELSEALDAYFNALSTQDPTSLPLTTNAKFTENGKTLKLGTGKLWPIAGETLMRRDAIDTVQCAAATQAVVLSNNKESVLGVRIQLEKGLISEIETLYVQPNFLLSNPQNLINTLQPEWDETLPEDKRSTPVALRAYADSYFNALDTSGTQDYIPAPFSDSCNRWENGVKMTFNNCQKQLQNTPFNTLQIGMVHRRFPVMDTEKGIAIGFASFTNIWNMMEMFLIRDAKIQKIQAVLVPWTGSHGW